MMKGKKIAAAALLYFGVLSVNAQQKPHYTQYVQNMSVINPSVTGMYKGIHVKAGMRNQWQGLESAPRTSYFTISSPVAFGGNFSSKRGSDYGVIEPATKADRLGYESSENHHAMGGVLLSDRTGAISRTTVNFTYAFHLAIGDNSNLSMGVGGGANRVSLNTGLLHFEEEGDAVIAGDGSINKWTPDLNAGVMYYSPSFYFGASVQQATNSRISFDPGYGGKETPHYFVTTGLRVWIKEDFSVTPSVMFKYVSPTPFAYDLNLKLAYRNNFWLAGSWRKKDALSILAGFCIAQNYSIGYGYDVTTSDIKNVQSGTHEIAIGLIFQ